MISASFLPWQDKKPGPSVKMCQTRARIILQVKVFSKCLSVGERWEWKTLFFFFTQNFLNFPLENVAGFRLIPVAWSMDSVKNTTFETSEFQFEISFSEMRVPMTNRSHDFGQESNFSKIAPPVHLKISKDFANCSFFDDWGPRRNKRQRCSQWKPLLLKFCLKFPESGEQVAQHFRLPTALFKLSFFSNSVSFFFKCLPQTWTFIVAFKTESHLCIGKETTIFGEEKAKRRRSKFRTIVEATLRQSPAGGCI